MNRKHVKKSVAVLAVVAIVGMSVNAFAGKGFGRGNWGPGDCRGGGYGANLSDEDLQQLQEQRNAFFEATSDLRQQIQQKRLALRYEMAKTDPDAARVKSIHKELSGLNAQFGEKRIEHVLEMKKLNPNAGAGWMGAGPGQGRGWHRGSGGGMGYGPGGGMGYGPGGGCWN